MASHASTVRDSLCTSHKNRSKHNQKFKVLLYLHILSININETSRYEKLSLFLINSIYLSLSFVEM